MATAGNAVEMSRAAVSLVSPEAPGVLIVESPDQLQKYLAAWSALASRALVPNPFYEPWMLLPALQFLPEARDVIFALVFLPEANGRTVLTGFFPLKVRCLPLGIPIAVISTWIHKYCYLSIPLLDRQHARETLELFLDWMKGNRYHGRILDLRLVPGDGPFQALLAEVLTVRQQMNLVVRSFPRAVLPCSENSFEHQLTSKMRRDLRMREKRLAELGEHRFTKVVSVAELESWVKEFLRVEASGWKGKEGVSFSHDPSGTRYLRAMLSEAIPAGRALLNMLVLNDKPIALQGCVISGGGAFGFVMTYDEECAKCSPGVLLACETSRALQDIAAVQLADSCSHCDHPLFDRLWRGKRMMQRILVSDGTPAGGWLTSMAPMLQWGHGWLCRRRKAVRHVHTNTGT